MSRKSKLNQPPTALTRGPKANYGQDIDEKIIENICENEEIKSEKLLNLIAEIIVNATLKQLHETGD